jgi:hypothetical protein
VRLLATAVNKGFREKFAPPSPLSEERARLLRIDVAHTPEQQMEQRPMRITGLVLGGAIMGLVSMPANAGLSSRHFAKLSQWCGDAGG